MAQIQGNTERDRALARLKCAHCQALMNCEALAQSVLSELQSRFFFVSRAGDEASKVSDANLIAAVRDGIDKFLAGLMDEAA